MTGDESDGDESDETGVGRGYRKQVQGLRYECDFSDGDGQCGW
jgi:hypothetical protein